MCARSGVQETCNATGKRAREPKETKEPTTTTTTKIILKNKQQISETLGTLTSGQQLRVDVMLVSGGYFIVMLF